MKEKRVGDVVPVDISEHDVVEAMKCIDGYIDITPGGTTCAWAGVPPRPVTASRWTDVDRVLWLRRPDMRR